TSPTTPPQVLTLHSIRAKRKGLTAVVVGFDQPMDPARIQDAGIYRLVIVPKGKKARVKPVRLASANYDAATNSVRLTLRKPVKTGVLRLTIDHSGAVAANGTPLFGGDYVARLPK